MQTEDHPIDYGDFEGVIPEGYGAGIVMLWDKGTWTPEADDIDAAIRKGDLKFTLNGFKLKGSWVLVRTGGRYPGARSGDGARSWLLIKHRDEWSGDLDITEFAPRSVKSEGDFEDILAEDTPAVWVSHRPATGGDAGAMLAQIIERAAALKAGRAGKREGGDTAASSSAPASRAKSKPAATSRNKTAAATSRNQTAAATSRGKTAAPKRTAAAKTPRAATRTARKA
jgi:bifunctional non-homologous end joining protein LigD